MRRFLGTARRSCATLIASVSAVPACAQEGPEPWVTGPYLVAAAGSSENSSEPGFVSCVCRSDKSKVFKFGGGYRFGVSAIEGWFIDFGSATFPASLSRLESTAHIRALAAGAAWTARFGSWFDTTWRIGVADVSLTSQGQSSTRAFRPIIGMSSGIRVTDAVYVEVSFDRTGSSDDAGTSVDVNAFALGLRFRF
jgi:hypothetical protein